MAGNLSANFSPVLYLNDTYPKGYVCFNWLNDKFSYADLKKETGKDLETITWYIGSTLSKQKIHAYLNMLNKGWQRFTDAITFVGFAEISPEILRKDFENNVLQCFYKYKYYKIIIDATKINKNDFMMFATMVRQLQENPDQVEDVLEVYKYIDNPIDAYMSAMYLTRKPSGFISRGSGHELQSIGWGGYKRWTDQSDFRKILEENKKQCDLLSKPIKSYGRIHEIVATQLYNTNLTNRNGTVVSFNENPSIIDKYRDSNFDFAKLINETGKNNRGVIVCDI